MAESLLQIENLVTHYRTKRGVVQAVSGVSFQVNRGEAVGIVGESGCGKSATGQSIIGLIEHPGRIISGNIRFKGEDLTKKSPVQMRRIRGAQISMIFQDPTTTLNPVFTIGDQIAELFKYHSELSSREAKERVLAMLEQIGIPEPGKRYNDYPHEFSGGMQQRVVIACALILNPALVIADEPTTALDVTVQAQILGLLQRLQAGDANTAIILISHDLGVVAQMCQRVCVMYAGEIIEMSSTKTILESPKHPYTLGLIASIPKLDMEDKELKPIPGMVADPINPPPGCKFHPRCPRAFERCHVERPTLKQHFKAHHIACHLFDGDGL